MQLYYYSEKNNYIVAGTTNKSEVAQGFYVKFGDGGVDIEPIAHLYKTQVYELAKDLGVIDEIIMSWVGNRNMYTGFRRADAIHFLEYL